MLGRTLRTATEFPAEGAIVLGTYDNVLAAPPLARQTARAAARRLLAQNAHRRRQQLPASSPPRPIAASSTAPSPCSAPSASKAPINELNVRDKPFAPIRILNHWDNLDGTIERGYAGRSIFWENGHITKDLGRVRDYARLMASVGINGCSINNVNADTRVISAELLPEVARVADVFRPWGVKLYISLDFASPREARRHQHVRPARSGRRRLLEKEGRRDLQSDPRPRRLRAQGR